MKGALLNTGMAVFGIALALLVMEGLSRIFFKSDFTRIVDQHGRPAAMRLQPGNPSAGLIPHFEGRMISGEFDVSIKLDHLGFREKAACGNGAAAPLHLTLLGDSFMFGWGVEFPESFAACLATHLCNLTGKKVIVSPLAIPGTGQFSQIALLRRALAPKPDVVLLGMYLTNHVASGNDLIENLNDFYKYNSIGNAAGQHPPAAARPGFLLRMRRWLKYHSNLFRLAEARLGGIMLSRAGAAFALESDPHILASAWAVTDSLVLQLQKTAAAQGAMFAIQYVPNMLDVARRDSAAFMHLKKTCAAGNIPLAPNPISLFNPPEQKANLGDFYFLVDGHWTARAHQVAAAATAKFIARELGYFASGLNR